MVLCLQRICLDLPLYILLCALPIEDYLSQCMHIGGTSLGHLGISSKKWRNHLASSPHMSSTAINSDSIVDLEITVCFEDFRETAPSPNINT